MYMIMAELEEELWQWLLLLLYAEDELSTPCTCVFQILDKLFLNFESNHIIILKDSVDEFEALPILYCAKECDWKVGEWDVDGRNDQTQPLALC